MRLLKYIVATRRPGCTSPSSVIFLLIPPLVRQPPTRRLYQPTDSAEEPILEQIGSSDPPVDELFRDLSEEYDVTEEELREAWMNTHLGTGE